MFGLRLLKVFVESVVWYGLGHIHTITYKYCFDLLIRFFLIM